jgi:hypothetical protein
MDKAQKMAFAIGVDIGELEREMDDVTNTENISDYVDVLKKVREYKDMIATASKHINKVYDKINREIVPAKFDRDGVTSITHNGFRYTMSLNTRARILPDHKIEAFDWLRKNELGDLITETVNASTLSATAKELMRDGYELDSDFFETYVQPGMSITKAK